MKKRALALLVILVFMSLIIDYGTYSLYNNESEQKVVVESRKSNKASDVVNLTILSYYQGFEYEAKDYHKKHPNVNVKIEVVSFDQLIPTALSAIAKGSGPDIIVIDSGLISSFNGNEALENLLEKPFDAEKYKRDFREDIWNSALSFSKKRLIGIPIVINPMIAYYRADIMKQYGFPSEPQALSQYMKDPNNWLKIARTLKPDNRFITSWATDPMSIYDTGTGVFDERLNFLRTNSNFEKAIELSKIIKMDGLSLNSDIYGEDGKLALKDGRLAMIYGGSWLMSTIRDIAPDDKGKWRAANLPFGINGFASSNLLSISSASKNKEEAWKFIKKYKLNKNQSSGGVDVPLYLPAARNLKNFSFKDDFYGGQDLGNLYEGIRRSLKVPLLTPLDDKAKQIWSDKVQAAIVNDINPKDAFRLFEEEFNNELSGDKKILLDSLK